MERKQILLNIHTYLSQIVESKGKQEEIMMFLSKQKTEKELIDFFKILEKYLKKQKDLDEKLFSNVKRAKNNFDEDAEKIIESIELEKKFNF